MRSGTNSNCHAPRTSTEAKWEKAKMHNLAESSFIFNCRESSSRIHPQQSQYEKSRLSPSSRPFGDEIWAPVLPMLPFSHSNLPTYSSYIYLPYLHVRRSRRRDDGGESPSWTQFGRYSVFFSFFLFAIILRSPLVRSINVYDVAQSRSSFFLESLHDYSLRITSLLKLFPIRKVPSSRPTTEETSLLICYIGSGAFARICRLANARVFLSHHPPSCFWLFSNFFLLTYHKTSSR